MRLSLLAMLVPFVLRTEADTMEVVSVIDADGSELSKKMVWLPESGWARSFYIIGGCSPRGIPNITTICLDPVRRRGHYIKHGEGDKDKHCLLEGSTYSRWHVYAANNKTERETPWDNVPCTW